MSRVAKGGAEGDTKRTLRDTRRDTMEEESSPPSRSWSATAQEQHSSPTDLISTPVGLRSPPSADNTTVFPSTSDVRDAPPTLTLKSPRGTDLPVEIFSPDSELLPVVPVQHHVVEGTHQAASPGVFLLETSPEEGGVVASTTPEAGAAAPSHDLEGPALPHCPTSPRSCTTLPRAEVSSGHSPSPPDHAEVSSGGNNFSTPPEGGRESAEVSGGSLDDFFWTSEKKSGSSAQMVRAEGAGLEDDPRIYGGSKDSLSRTANPSTSMDALSIDRLALLSESTKNDQLLQRGTGVGQEGGVVSAAAYTSGFGTKSTNGRILLGRHDREGGYVGREVCIICLGTGKNAGVDAEVRHF